MIKDKISQVKSDISLICQRLGKNPADITIVGVTKLASVKSIEEAIGSGIVNIAENRVQEGQKKYPQLKISPSLKITKHLIGHLQTNKAKEAVKVFDIIQSVDSLRLAQELDKEAAKINRVVDVLLQINTAAEPQKYGVANEKALPLVEEFSRLKHVRVLGLMAIAPLTEDKKSIHAAFRKLREFYERIKKDFRTAKNIEMKYLSMGMSSDYVIALEEGSNMLRIGSAIFSAK